MPHKTQAMRCDAKGRLFTPGLIGLVLTLVSVVGHAQIRLAGIAESRGTGALPGTSFKNGYAMAVDEINASGGVIGQQLVLTQYDIDTTPAAAEEATKKALLAKPFAVLGPVFSGLTLAAMQHTAPSRTPHFTGGEAATLTQKFHPSLMRTSLSQLGSVPRLGALATQGLRAKKLGLLWLDNPFGRDGKAALQAAINRRGAAITFDVPVKPGQQDFARAVADIKTAHVDALVIYMTELESIGVLKELKLQGYSRPVLSDGLVASQMVIDGADGGAEGVLSHMGIFTEMPNAHMLAFAKRYTQKCGAPPDHNSVKGFFAVQLIRAGLELVGTVDAAKFLEVCKNTHFDGGRFPELINSVSYDAFGDLNRESYFVVIRGGHPRLVASKASTDSGSVVLAGGRAVALMSNEFRRDLHDAMTTGSAIPGKVSR